MRNISSEKAVIGPWHHDRQWRLSVRLTLAAIVIYLGLTGGVMARERALISSEWGNVTADLADNEAARPLVQQLPLTIEMLDHLRQEKTGNLPSPLPEIARQMPFSKGTLGLWSSDHFVIYYRDGRVPQPLARSIRPCLDRELGRGNTCGWSLALMLLKPKVGGRLEIDQFTIDRTGAAGTC